MREVVSHEGSHCSRVWAASLNSRHQINFFGQLQAVCAKSRELRVSGERKSLADWLALAGLVSS